MGVLTLVEVDVEADTLVEVDVEVETLLDKLVLTDVDTLVVLDVDTLELNDVDVDTLVLKLEYVEYTVVVGVFTLVEVEVDVDTLLDKLVLTDVDTLIVLDVDTLELNDVDVDTDVLALGKIKDSNFCLGAGVLSENTCHRHESNSLCSSHTITIWHARACLEFLSVKIFQAHS